MLCDKCGKNEATVHMMQNINGQVSEINLCSECAKQAESAWGFHPFDMNDIFQSFFDTGSIFTSSLPSLACKTCSTTLDSFKKTGLLGCPDCYDSLRQDIEPIISTMHGSTEHKGQRPEGEANPESTKENKVEMLNAQLQQAIAEERYEDAAKIRDEIKQMSEGGK